MSQYVLSRFQTTTWILVADDDSVVTTRLCAATLRDILPIARRLLSDSPPQVGSQSRLEAVEARRVVRAALLRSSERGVSMGTRTPIVWPTERPSLAEIRSSARFPTARSAFT